MIQKRTEGFSPIGSETGWLEILCLGKSKSYTYSASASGPSASLGGGDGDVGGRDGEGGGGVGGGGDGGGEVSGKSGINVYPVDSIHARD